MDPSECHDDVRDYTMKVGAKRFHENGDLR